MNRWSSGAQNEDVFGNRRGERLLIAVRWQPLMPRPRSAVIPNDNRRRPSAGLRITCSIIDTRPLLAEPRRYNGTSSEGTLN